MSANSSNQNWIKVCGENHAELEQHLATQLRSRIERGEFAQKDVEYVSKLRRNLIDGELDISNLHLEKLRRLCQLWDIELRVEKITSHRPLIGPFIVFFKKLCLPVLRVLLRSVVDRQRGFNAAAINLLADLTNQKANSKQLSSKKTEQE